MCDAVVAPMLRYRDAVATLEAQYAIRGSRDGVTRSFPQRFATTLLCLWICLLALSVSVCL
jgi:hypothetical protein